MKVAYFSNQFAEQKGHGIARYARHLHRAMLDLENSPEIIPIAAWTDRSKESLEELQSATKLKIIPTGRRLTPLAWTYLNYPKLEHLLNESIDLVHAASMGYPIATKKPFVVTVHDIGPLTHPEYFGIITPNWVMEKSLRHAVRYASAFVCVSETTAQALGDYTKKHLKQNINNRIHVTLEGVSEHFFEPSRINIQNSNTDLYDITKKAFILTVGKMSPRKNLRLVLEALSKISDIIPHNLLTVGGSTDDYEQMKRYAHSLGIENRVHFLGYVSDEELKYLYQQASVFVYPSLFEGFGLTILEAMASSCPVITSNLSSLPEVAGDASILIDPTDIAAAAASLEAVCTNAALAQELSVKGLARAKQFTWTRCAEGVVQVYNSCV